jgi:hypothetical protein
MAWLMAPVQKLLRVLKVCILDLCYLVMALENKLMATS